MWPFNIVQKAAEAAVYLMNKGYGVDKGSHWHIKLPSGGCPMMNSFELVAFVKALKKSRGEK